ncbi:MULTISPECIES: ZIP family metal transporter [Psychrobacter]|mgnify:CR=1 FL=1|jgi:ZIP family zinc transporter|uniref:ZIP family metal transporter n=1 Tax=Psychrobacter TaxID=497 RepID=UPI001BB05555|nr:zinc transporter [Psychrobacter sp. UBA2514]|tara:strand:- start:2403 stop:3101 length:699 start_codon:yes stop_codon:yes gene_type:complete
MLVFAIILVVSGALIIGALWGLYGYMPDWIQGNLLALAGGALMSSVVLEMIQPAIGESGLWTTVAFTVLGAVVFTAIDYLIDEKMQNKGGAGLLAAITLDGIPENLALGVALIGGNALQVAALAGSILLSNLPEAAGGAKQMRDGGSSHKKILMLWIGAAILLSLAAIIGKMLLKDVDDAVISAIDCFAAGAVIASLATEVFPSAFKDGNHWAGISTAIGLVLALGLNQLGG